jgi:hypothetical protein
MLYADENFALPFYLSYIGQPLRGKHALVFLYEGVCYIESNVMPGAGILGADVSQSCY